MSANYQLALIIHFKPELKLYKGNKKNLRPFISPVPETDKTKKQAVFTVNPYDFNPMGLVMIPRKGTKNGLLISWMDLDTNTEVFRWDENTEYDNGAHYHIYGTGHYYAGDLVPEPYATIYFSR